VKPLKIEPEITLTGGVVHNPAFVTRLTEALGLPVNASPDNEYAGALGAALLGRYRLGRVAA
jgi:activator of 2-hydroxyglutaryl-CoA dehydratase